MSTVRGTISNVATAAAEPRRAPHALSPAAEPEAPFLLRNGVGLFLAATAFLTVGALDWWLYPPVGPGAFPLSTLLLLLGFVAAIGGTLAYFFGREDPFAAHAEPAPEPPTRAVPAFRPDPEEYGRPKPEVRRPEPLRAGPSPAAPPLVPGPAPAPAASAVSPASGAVEVRRAVPPAPPPEPALDADPEPDPNPPAVHDALAELSRIEREMGARRPRAPAP